MDLVNVLVKNLSSGDSVKELSGKTGASAPQIESLIKSAVPSLMSSMNGNASSKDGAASLLEALSQHTNTDKVSKQIKDADEEDGNKILEHILGGSKNDFMTMLAKETGLDFGQTNSVLSNIAPALMSSVSAANKTNTASKDDTSITGLLGSLFVDDDDKDILDGLKGNSLLDTLKNAIL